MTLADDVIAAGIRDRLFIGGEFVDALDGATFETLYPHDGSVLARVARAGTADIDRAVAAAAGCLLYTSPSPRD